MTSDHTSEPDHVNAHDLATWDGSARLSLKPSSSVRGIALLAESGWLAVGRSPWTGSGAVTCA
jgi:hypothetical protein